MTSVHLPSLHPPTSPTPGNPLTPSPPPPGLSVQCGKQGSCSSLWGRRGGLPGVSSVLLPKGLPRAQAAWSLRSWLFLTRSSSPVCLPHALGDRCV